LAMNDVRVSVDIQYTALKTGQVISTYK